MHVKADHLDFRCLNRALQTANEDCTVSGCLGQRFIAAGMGDRHILISGIPGNALGAYLNGARIEVTGNAQDAVGDTMNSGTIIVHGNIGDAAGYAMRGGEIYVKGNAGYRAGVHMKAYGERVPVLVIGGRAGSFLGEYQAGGIILVLGLNTDGKPLVSNFPCTGMHGGKLFLRGDCTKTLFPKQVTAHIAGSEEKEIIRPYVEEYCRLFGANFDAIFASDFTVAEPDSKNPYKQMYVLN